MNIIDAKKREADALGKETVYNGPVGGHKFSSQATFLTAQQRGVLAALTRVGRTYDNLYIRKNGSERWHLFSSKGNGSEPPVLFWFWYDSYGFKSFVYVGWNKIKTDQFLAMPDVDRDQLLTSIGPIDLEAIWKKDRSIDNIGFALEAMPRQTVDAAIGKISKKLKANVANMDITQANINRIVSLVSSLERIGTGASRSLLGEITDSFKNKTMVALLKAMKRDQDAMPYWLVPRALDILTRGGIDWPELEIIRDSLEDDSRMRQGIDESDEWISTIHNRLIRDAEMVLNHDVPNGNYWAIGRVIQELKAASIPQDMISKLMERHRQDIAEMQAWLLGEEMAGVQAGLSNMVALVSIGLDWPELKESLEHNKHAILKTTLWDIANSSEDMYTNDGLPILYGDLVKIGVDWPELQIIRDSLAESTTRQDLDEISYLPGGYKDLSHYSEEEQLAAVKRWHGMLAHFPNATPMVQLAAIEKNPHSIGWVDDPSEEVQLAAIEQSTTALRDIKKPTVNVQRMAVKSFPRSIRWIADPSEEVQMLAINLDPDAIEGIRNPTAAVQLHAIAKNPGAITGVRNIAGEVWLDRNIKDSLIRIILTWVKDGERDEAETFVKHLEKNQCPWPELEIISSSLEYDRDLRPRDDEINENGWSDAKAKQDLDEADNITVRDIKAFLRDHPEAIFHMQNPSPEIIAYAVRNTDYPDDILQRFGKNLGDDTWARLIKAEPELIAYAKKPSERLQMMAINADPSMIREIQGPSLAVQMAAFKADPTVVKHIKKPSKELIKLATEQGYGRYMPHAVKLTDANDQLAAIRHDFSSITHIKDLKAPAIKWIVRNRPHRVEDALLHGSSDGIEKSKNEIIRFLLKSIRNNRDDNEYPPHYGTMRSYLIGVIKLLRALKVTWPELDIIADGIKALKPRELGETNAHG